MAVSATEVDNIIVRLVGDATSYQKMIDNAIKSTKTGTKQIEQSSKSIQGVASSVGMLAASISSLLVATAGTGNTLAAFGEFDKAMTESIAIMKVTEDQIHKMRKSALDLAPAAGLGPEVLARGFYFLASSGLDAERAIGALPAVINFAVAGNFDLARATTLSADAQAALGLKVKDATKNLENLVRITDVLVKGNILSNTTTEQLSRALSTGAAAAGKIFGKEVEEVAAVLAVFADQGIKAEVAGNALSRVYRLLGYAAVKNAEAFKKFNISVFDQQGNMRNTADIMEDMEKAFAPLSDAARVAALDMIGFEARVQHAVLPLLGTSKQIREFEKELKAAGGTTERVAEITRTSFSFQMRALAANIKVVAVEIGAFLAPAISRIANVINTSITFWRALGDEVKKTSISIGLFLVTMAGLGPLRNILAALGSIGVAAITPLITILGALALAIVNPFRILIFWFNPTFTLFRYLISIIGAVVVAMQRVGGAEEAFRKVEEALIGVWEWLKPIKDALVSLGQASLKAVIEIFMKLGNVMLETFRIIGVNINIDWMKVQTFLVRSIQLIEFTIVNFGKIAKMVGTGLYIAFLPLIQVFQASGQEAADLSRYLEPLIRHLIVIGVIVAGLVITFKILSPIITALVIVINSLIVAYSVLRTTILLLSPVFSFLKIVFISVISVVGLLIKELLILGVVLVGKLFQAGVAFGAQVAFVAGLLGLSITQAIIYVALTKLQVIANLAAAVGLAILNAVIVVFNALMSLSISSIVLMIAGLALLKLAFAALSVVLSGVIIIFTVAFKALIAIILTAIGSVFGVLGTVIAALISPIVGTYLALYELTKVLQQIPLTSGPLAALGNIFKEWFSIIKDVADAVSIDMDLAWKIFQAGVMLGIEQIKAMWPSLWEFIKLGFITAGTLIKDVIGSVFDYIKGRIDIARDSWGNFIDPEAIKDQIAALGNTLELDMKLHASKAGRAIREGLTNFKPDMNTDGIKEATKEVKKFQAELEEAKWIADLLKQLDELEGVEDPIKKVQKEIDDLIKKARGGLGIEEGAKKGQHAVENLTSAIEGSAEAATRMQKYMDLFFLNDKGGLVNLNQEGVKSTKTDLYEKDTEWAEERARMEEAEAWMEAVGHSFVNDLQNTDWDTVLQGFSDTVNEISQNILFHTKVVDTVITDPAAFVKNRLNEVYADMDSILMDKEHFEAQKREIEFELQGREEGLPGLTNISENVTDKEMVEYLKRIQEILAAIENKQDLADLIELGGLDA